MLELFLLASLLSSAEESTAATVLQGESPPLAWRDEVTVTATRQPRPVEEMPAHVTVMGAADLRQSAAVTPDDALRRVPGFSLFRRAGSRTAHPTTQGVSLRGIGPSGTSRSLVLLDGVVLNDPFGGWIYWSRLPKAALERVEILHGAGSDLWGSSALGGVIQLLTVTPEKRFVDLTAEVGSRDEVHLDLAAGRSAERLSLMADVRAFQGARYAALREDQRGVIDVPAGSGHGAFYGKLRYALSPRSSLELRGNFVREERDNGTPLTGNRTLSGYVSSIADLVTDGGSSWRFAVTAFAQSFDNLFSSQAADRGSERPALDQFDVGSEALRSGVQWSRLVGARHRMTGGGELAWTRASTAEDFLFSATVGDGRFLRRRHAGGKELSAGLYLHDEITLGARWRLSVSGRLDRWETRGGFRREVSLEDGSTLRDNVLSDRVFSDRGRTLFSPRLGWHYRPSSRMTVYGALYRAFRAPTINELFRPFRVRNDVTAANAALGPETLAGLETGVAYRGPRLRGNLTIFWNRLDDAVANLTVATGPGVVTPCGFVPAGGLCRQRRPLDRSRVRGVEAGLAFRASPAWSLSARWLLSSAEIRRSTDMDLVGKRLLQVPEQQWVLAVDRTDSQHLGGRLQLRYVGEQFEDDLNRRPLAAFLVADLSLRHELKRGWELFVAVENLLDRVVETGKTADGLVSVGAPRLVHGGVRYQRR